MTVTEVPVPEKLMTAALSSGMNNVSVLCPSVLSVLRYISEERVFCTSSSVSDFEAISFCVSSTRGRLYMPSSNLCPDEDVYDAAPHELNTAAAAAKMLILFFIPNLLCVLYIFFRTFVR